MKFELALFAAIAGLTIAADAQPIEVAVAEIAAVVNAPRRHVRARRVPNRSLYSSSSSSSSSSDDKPRRHRRRHRHCTDSTYRLDSTTELESSNGRFRFSSSSSSSSAAVVVPPAPQTPIVDPNVVIIDVVEETTVDADATPVVAQNAEFKRAFVQEVAHQKNAVKDVSADGFWGN